MKFSLANLLLLFAIFALGLGWYVDHVRMQRKIDMHVVSSSAMVRASSHAFMIFDDASAEHLHAALRQDRNTPLDDREISLLRDILQLYKADQQSSSEERSALRFHAGMWMELRNWDTPAALRAAMGDVESIFDADSPEYKQLDDFVVKCQQSYAGQ